MKIETKNMRENFDEKAFNDFVYLYNRTFTDFSSWEDPLQWREKLIHDLRPPEPKINLIIASKSDFVIGGIVFEHYRQSKCGFLTYLVVDQNYRRKGIARKIKDHAISVLKKEAIRINSSLYAVFGEIEDPRIITKNSNGLVPIDRLEIFSHLNAKLIDIPYIQPQLKGGKGRCRHLLLINFPMSDLPFIDSRIIKNFLFEFYLSLGVSNPNKDVDFLLMMNHLENKIPLNELEFIGRKFHEKRYS